MSWSEFNNDKHQSCDFHFHFTWIYLVYLSPSFYFFFFSTKEDLAWANICVNLPLFCMWVAAIAWLPTSGVGPCTGTEPKLLKWSALNLTTRPWAWPWFCFLFATLYGWAPLPCLQVHRSFLLLLHLVYPSIEAF